MYECLRKTKTRKLGVAAEEGRYILRKAVIGCTSGDISKWVGLTDEVMQSGYF